MDRRRIGRIRIVRAVVAVLTAVFPVRIIDAVRRILATVPAVRVADRVCVVRVGAEVAEVFSSLPIPKVRRLRLDNCGNKHCEKGECGWFG